MKLLVLPGDGIGPEITDATLAVLEAADHKFGLQLDSETKPIGLASLDTVGTTLPDDVLETVRAVDGVILGPVSHYDYPPRDRGGINPSAELRTVFDLYSNVRPCRSRADLTVLRHPMDIVIVRENTEGFYSDRNMYAGSGEFMPDQNSAFSIRKITAEACSAVARTAFELASQRHKKVTAVHKANVVKLSDGLFLREVRKVAQDYPDVELEELIVDATAALLIRRPGHLRRAGHHEHVRRHPLRRGIRALRQPRARGRHQRRPGRLRRPGATRVRTGHRRQERRQPHLADPVGRDAAAVARPAAPAKQLRRCR